MKDFGLESREEAEQSRKYFTIITVYKLCLIKDNNIVNMRACALLHYRCSITHYFRILK
jgi:hypothetical protein